ncbi:hypothetical protein DOM21_09005 [Bacteriovorax stolpii]|uniref:hypothetical protein n=1 Tax=Bacteriovorax stolpii TaxID=960 RepID=UPI001158CDA9|nr:hypothetical protein [Bacteriovorax stolpii]QDK41587.1 hypothetical protein DOM21_09005 [Bacteriovorax stolpii]BDT28557.1 hypothetical protein BHI3_20230 [Bacteriovorax sp. HI3]
MNTFKLLVCLLCLSLAGCAEMGLKPHKPSTKNSLEIAKTAGMFQILTIKGATPEITKILNSDLMSCGATTFSMPRGNTVGTFVREIFEQELISAKKLSDHGTPVEVVIKSMDLSTISKENGVWTIEIAYTANDKTTNVKTITEFESKVSLLTSCTHTASVFEDTMADNLVEFFNKIR